MTCKSLPARPLFWEHERNAAVRYGKYLPPTMPAEVRRMTAMYRQWAQRTGVLPWVEVQRIRAQKDAEARRGNMPRQFF